MSVVFMSVLCQWKLVEIELFYTAMLYMISGKYHCPVTFRIFNENSHIVAIRTSGNVVSYEVSLSCCLFTSLHLCWQELIPFSCFDSVTISADCRPVGCPDVVLAVFTLEIHDDVSQQTANNELCKYSACLLCDVDKVGDYHILCLCATKSGKGAS